MFTMRAFVTIAFVGLLILSNACRKKSPPVTAPADPAPVQAPATPAVAAPAPEPANVPTGAGTKLAPTEKDDAVKAAAKTQDRFNRNSLWMAKLGKNDPQLRAQVLAEIQKAGLSPAEMQELRKQAQMYGIKF